MTIPLQTLQETVQKNCHISDASSAGNYTLCIYLMKMREFYRWENRFPFDSPLPKDAVGQWLRQREALWDELESTEFEPIQIHGEDYDPFDNTAINAQLNQHQLVYSGGQGYQSKSHFFLARLKSRQQLEDYEILISGEEFARDLSAPPAMAQGKTIYVRRESFRRFLWEKSEEAGWHKGGSALQLSLQAYGFHDAPLQVLETMTEQEMLTVLDHEIGEVMVGKELGSQWEELLAAIPLARTELMLRAVRDHYADAISTLPKLLERNQPASIHFYFANLSNLRKHLYPSLYDAYHAWQQHQDTTALLEQVEHGKDHWQSLAKDILKQFPADTAKEQVKALDDLIESRRL